MTPDQIDLARRLVACPRWRWVPGMRLECGDILLWSDDQHWHCCGDNQNWIRWRHDRIGQAERGSLPDLTDPATAGVLLGMLGRPTTLPAPWICDWHAGVPMGEAVARTLLVVWNAEVSP